MKIILFAADVCICILFANSGFRNEGGFIIGLLALATKIGYHLFSSVNIALAYGFLYLIGLPSIIINTAILIVLSIFTVYFVNSLILKTKLNTPREEQREPVDQLEGKGFWISFVGLLVIFVAYWLSLFIAMLATS